MKKLIWVRCFRFSFPLQSCAIILLKLTTFALQVPTIPFNFHSFQKGGKHLKKSAKNKKCHDIQ
jgi:hypothetical protein